MVVTPTIQEYLLDAERTMQIRSAIHEGASQYGMQTFDQSLMKLYKDGLITLEDAIRSSTSPTEFELRIRGIQSSSDSKWKMFEGDVKPEDDASKEPPGRRPGKPGEPPRGMVRY
jgi:twitching motility protein PilT